jgi:hypothetical protein
LILNGRQIEGVDGRPALVLLAMEEVRTGN